MRIEPFDPVTASAEDCLAWVGLWQAVRKADRPEPELPARFWLTTARLGLDGYPVRSWSVRDAAGAMVAAASLTLPELDNTHTGVSEVVVHPAHRRRGIGTHVLRHVAAAVRESGRRLLIGETLDPGPGPAFCRAVGAERGLVEPRRVLDLPASPDLVAALRADAEGHATGYTLVRWHGGRVPDALRADTLRLFEQVSDAPVDDLEWEREVWDADRLRCSEESLDQAGIDLYGVAVRPGERPLVGHTLVWVHRECPAWAWQGDTVVMPEHRGRRLGMLMKTAMLQWLAEAEPGIEVIETGNAASNGYMIAINEALGFRVLDRWEEWQLVL